MEQMNNINLDPKTTIRRQNPAALWANLPRAGNAVLADIPAENQPIGKAHACRAYQRSLQQARDRLKRAERDLGETAAFVAASLTTVTAVEAVINIAVSKLELRQFPLRQAFEAYIIIFLLIFAAGLLRGMNAMHRRAQAEKDVDQAKQGMFEFCPIEQWPKFEE